MMPFHSQTIFPSLKFDKQSLKGLEKNTPNLQVGMTSPVPAPPPPPLRKEELQKSVIGFLSTKNVIYSIHILYVWSVTYVTYIDILCYGTVESVNNNEVSFAPHHHLKQHNVRLLLESAYVGRGRNWGGESSGYPGRLWFLKIELEPSQHCAEPSRANLQ